MTKRQISLLIIMGFSAVGFVVDQFILSEPAAAEAKSTADKPAAPSKSKPSAGNSRRQQPAAPSGTVVVPDPSLAYLEKLADPNPRRDVFAPSPAWIKAQKEATERSRTEAANHTVQPGSAQAFQANHRLQATTVMERGGLAVVDHQCLTVGDVLEDFQLVRVTAGEVEFRRGRDRAILRLPMAPTTSSRPAAATQPTGNTNGARPEANGSATNSKADSAARPSRSPSLLRRLFGSQ